MRACRHPLSGSIYEYADDGVGPVLVTKDGGASGRFTSDGVWVSGDVRSADPEMCRWIASGGSQRPGGLGSSRRYAPSAAEAS